MVLKVILTINFNLNIQTLQMTKKLKTKQLIKQEINSKSISKSKSKGLDSVVSKEFYNPDVMTSAMCIADSIFYTPPIQIGSVTSTMRIRYWLDQLRVTNLDSTKNTGPLLLK